MYMDRTLGYFLLPPTGASLHTHAIVQHHSILACIISKAEEREIKEEEEMNTDQDLFDEVLNLEDQFYSEGYQQGVADGERAGRIEGRSFGIEKGFEKFAEAGRLYGKSIVWANRLGPAAAAAAAPLAPSSSATALLTPEEVEATPPKAKQLPRLQGARLEKNIVTLHALVELETLSIENTDDAVNDFDDRVKRAQGKARVIERQLGEDGSAGANASASKQQKRDGGSGGSGGGGDGGGVGGRRQRRPFIATNFIA